MGNEWLPLFMQLLARPEELRRPTPRVVSEPRNIPWECDGDVALMTWPDPEPDIGLRVRDTATGDIWERVDDFTGVHPYVWMNVNDPDNALQAWETVAGQYGPVTLLPNERPI